MINSRIAGVLHEQNAYCTTLNVLRYQFLQFKESDVFAHFNFGIHNIP